ncbi:MAG TPA: DUF2339 domain-containing protein [Chthoniobacterales bacterium]
MDPESARQKLQAILEEQRELRERISALDRKIEEFVQTQAIEVEKYGAKKIEEKNEELPPPLPVLPHSTPVPPVSDRRVEMVMAPFDVDRQQQEAVRPPKQSVEFKIGTIWLVRIGIVILLTGLVFAGNYVYHNVIAATGPAVKVLLLYLAGGVLATIGARLEKKPSENLRNYGRVLLAGGAATIYYTSYAAAFVKQLQIIHNPLIGGIWLLAVAGLAVWLAERRKSQAVALLAILLAYYTSAINPLTSFSLISNVVLTVPAIYFLLRYRWVAISFAALIGTYLSFGFWRFYYTGKIWSPLTQTPGDFWLGATFLVLYWVLFTVGVFLSRAEGFPAEKRTPFLLINNVAFFALLTPGILGVYPDSFGKFCLGYGVVLLALARLAHRKQDADYFFDGSYLIQGLGVVTLGLSAELAGYQLSVALAVQSLVMAACTRQRHGWIYECGAALTALTAFFVAVAKFDDDPSAIHLLLAALFIGNAWLWKYRRGEMGTLVFRWRTAAYCLLAWVLALQVMLDWSSDTTRAVVLVVLGVGLTLTVRFTRMPELGILAQAYAILGFASWIVQMAGRESPPWQTAGTLGGMLALMHWWNRVEFLGWPLWARKTAEAVFSILALLVVERWTASGVTSREWWMVALATLAPFVWVYGALTTAAIFGALGQIFVPYAAGIFAYDLATGDPAWQPPALCLMLTAMQVALSRRLPSPFVGNSAEAIWDRSFRQVNSGILFVMTVLWGFEYVPDPALPLYFTTLASTLFFLAAKSLTTESTPRWSSIIYVALLAGLGVLSFWQQYIEGAPARWLYVAVFVLLGAMQRFGKRLFAGAPFFPSRAQIAVIVVVFTGIWAEISRWVTRFERDFLMTIAWALLATASLVVGLMLRERTYRLLGLSLLGLAVARVAFVDIWQLEKIYRILSLTVLGLVLMALGFVYNKFADKLKEWL